MKKLFFLFSLFVVSIGCGKIKPKNNTCIRFFDQLVFKDTSKVIVQKSRTPNFRDVLEKDDSSKEASFYQYDANKQLRFYAFLYNDSDYSFSIRYDSLGKIIKKTGGDVVKWVADKQGTDSMDVAFLLYSVGISYGKINMTIGKDTFNNIQLFQGRKFSSLVGASIRVSLQHIIGNSVYLSGIKRDDCTGVHTNFKDSILLEFPAYERIANPNK